MQVGSVTVSKPVVAVGVSIAVVLLSVVMPLVLFFAACATGIYYLWNQHDELVQKQIGRLKQELEKDTKRNAEEKEALKKAVSQSLEKEKALESLSKSLSEKQSLIESVRGSLSMSESRCLAVEQNAAALRLELEVERLGRAAAEKTAMTACEKEDISRVEHEKEVSKLRSDIATMKSAEEMLRAEIATSKNDKEVSKLRAEIETLQKALESAQLDVSKLQNHCLDVEMALKSQAEESLKIEVARMHHERTESENLLKKELEEKRSASAAELDRLKQQLGNAHQERLDAQVELTRQEQHSKAQLEARISALEAELQQAIEVAKLSEKAKDEQLLELKRHLDVEKKIAMESKNASGQSTSAMADIMADLQGELDACKRELDANIEQSNRKRLEFELELARLKSDHVAHMEMLAAELNVAKEELEKQKKMVLEREEDIHKLCFQLDDARAESSHWKSAKDELVEQVNRLEGRLAAAAASVASEAEAAQQRARSLVLDEMMKTESAYIADLSALDEVLLQPLRAGAVFKVEKAASVFKVEEFEGMMRASMQLLAALQKSPSIPKVCELFSTFIDSALSSYSGYCSGTYSTCSDLWLKNNNPKWIAFRKKVEVHPRLKGLPLDAVFIKPVQRLCKYPLLLVELKKHCTVGSSEHAELTRVIDKMNKAIMHINAIRRESELIQRLYEIEAGGVSGVPSTFFGPDRRLVREDQVVLVQGSKSKAVSCLMFSDCVLFIAPSKLRITSKAEYYAKIPPVFFSVTLLLNDVPDDLEHGHSNMVEFSFVREQSDERVTVFVSLATREQKLEWIQTIRTICEKMVVVVARKPSENVVLNPLKAQSDKVRASLRLRAASTAPSDDAEAVVAVSSEAKRKHSRSKSASIDKNLFVEKK